MIAQRNNDTNGAVSRNLFSSSPMTSATTTDRTAVA